MSLALHNTLTKRKEAFAPLDAANVRMYVCGPTVYDRAHIGNARPVIVFDTLFRLLQRSYPKVTYVRNITDVDDKIMDAAKAKGIAIDEVTSTTTRLFHEDMVALNALPPTVEPRATQHIAQMIAMIEKLVANGHAYVNESHVLFNVPSMPEYGRLSNRDRKEMIAGARVEVAPYKKDAADFVLWKPSADDQPGWNSPWGRGRPGWHIECSAMSEAHLGETFDIHGGGLDLVFPHHENEIAQSVCAHGGKPFVKVWMHNGFLSVNGEKMSKSLGNFFTVADVLEQAPGEAIRFYMQSAHYRAPFDWTADGLKQAKQGLDKLYRALLDAGDDSVPAGDVPAAVVDALEDDLNTPLAVAHLYELAKTLNKANMAGEPTAQAKADLLAAGHLLGVLQQDPATWLKWTPANSGALPDAEIDQLVAAWDGARKDKDYAKADSLRAQLTELKVSVSASPAGTVWRRAE